MDQAGAKRRWERVRDNRERHRFELDVEGETALAYYRIQDGVMVFTSTQTPRALQGQGVASELIRNALEVARERGLKVRSECSFVDAFLKKSPEFSDLAQ